MQENDQKYLLLDVLKEKHLFEIAFTKQDNCW